MVDESMMAEESHLSDYIHLLLQRKTTFFVTFFAVFVAVAVYTFTATPVYKAESTLFLVDDRSKAGLFGELLMSEVTPIASEIEILQSRTIAEETVKRLHLDWRISKQSQGLSFKLIDCSAPPLPKAFISFFSQHPTFTIRLISPTRYSVVDIDGKKIGEGRSGALFRTPQLTLLLDEITGQSGDQFTLELLPFKIMVRRLMAKLIAAEKKAKTNILLISFLNSNPETATSVVNTLVQVYLEKRISFNNEEASKTLDFIDHQLERIQDDLDNSEKRIQEYKEQSGVVDLDGKAANLVDQITQIEKQKAEANLKRKQAEFALSAMHNAELKGELYSPSLMRDEPVVASLAVKLADLELSSSALLTEVTADHPALVRLQRQIEEVQRQIKSTYETSIRNSETYEDSLDQLIVGYENDLQKMPTSERELAGLMRYAKVNSDIYTLLLQKREEASIAKASTISKLRVVDPAIVPTSPVKPRKRLYLVLGIFAGLIIGILFAFFQEYLDDTIKDPENAKRRLGVPLLASIPHIPGKMNGEKSRSRRKPVMVQGDDEGGRIQETLITHLEPKSPVSEAFRNLRTSIRFLSKVKKAKVIMLSSSFQGEGKSTISANLAISMVQSGLKVLLIDCDLRRPSLHHVFGHGKSPGVTDIIAGDIGFEDAVHKLNIPGLDLISSGVLPPNPSELLGSDMMRELVMTAVDRYDHVILDSPPVLAVTDARLLTVLSDMVFLVIEVGRVPYKALEQVREMLGESLDSFIINQKNKVQSERYYGYSRYYHYGYYADEEPSDKKRWWRKGR